MILLQKLPVNILLLITGFLFWSSCSSNSDPDTVQYQLPIFADQDAADEFQSRQEPSAPDFDQFSDYVVPPLSPQNALETFSLEEGFRIELVAHEPMVIDPVAMDIDVNGRLWVVEMPSYMPVHDQNEEETSELERVPLGRVVVLEDTDGDGFMDHHHIFADSLVLPRAIKVLDIGVLVAEPPNVWFISDTNGDGIGDHKEIVYNSYGNPDSDNVEHMPNALFWGMDNWIHSAHDRVESIRFENGEWITRPFERIGQWGMTQDDWGRLYSTNNSQTLTTHLSPYGYSGRHPEFEIDEGISENIAESERVWPAHTTGVNRGYQIGTIAREDGMLLRSTAISGPVIYRGDQFGDNYYGNAFSPEPAGNLIKRLVGLNEDPGVIDAVARFAYEEREFLTSTDERFRPVNLYNSPDGSMYVIDIYRGIFQHARFLTEHLRDYAVAHDLHRPGGIGQFGRIYRIVRDDREIDYTTPRLSDRNPEELVQYLTHGNGTLRDAAQQLLVQRSPASAISILEEYTGDMSLEFYTRLQALWTLEGYEDDIYQPDRLFDLAVSKLDDPHPRIRAAAVRILEPEIGNGNEELLGRLERMIDEENEPYTRLQLLASLGESDDMEVMRMMADIVDRNPENNYYREMILTGVYQREIDLLEMLTQDYGWRPGEDEDRDELLENLAELANRNTSSEPPLAEADLERFRNGAELFGTCLVCHGNQGQGMADIAPPLNESEWVNGDYRALTRIVLQGYDREPGSAGVNYDGIMPAHGFLEDEEIASILTYIRNSWDNDASPVSVDQVTAIREATENRQETWSGQELQDLIE